MSRILSSPPRPRPPANRVLVAAIVTVTGLVSSHSTAQQPDPGTQRVLTGAADQQHPEGRAETPDTFGLHNSRLNIPAAAFSPRSSDVGWIYADPGYIYPTSTGTSEPFWAAVDLPDGAVILALGLYFDDIDPAENVSATLRVYTGVNQNNASFFDVATATSIGTPYKGGVYATLLHTVRNNTWNGGGMYAVVIGMPATGGTLGFKGVDLIWHRQISPPPATATFGDVPTSDSYFQAIEALVASGITSGCGDGNFCPDAPLTRRQMAVFLAKAMGLHWE